MYTINLIEPLSLDELSSIAGGTDPDGVDTVQPDVVVTDDMAVASCPDGYTMVTVNYDNQVGVICGKASDE